MNTLLTKRLNGLLCLLFLMNGLWAQSWAPQEAGTPHPVIAIQAVDENVVWACGWEGTYLRTTDGGENWTWGKVPDPESFDLYSVAAIDADTAYFAGSAFQATDTRIYKTTDGGQSWELQYQNTQPDAFFNSIAFWDGSHGIAVSDAVDGSFLIVTTSNGGATWEVVPPEHIPSLLPGEWAGFADGGGTCLAVQEGGYAWFGTAYDYGLASEGPVRVFRSSDWGRHWTAVETPVSNNAEGKGVFTMAFQDTLHGFAAGEGVFIQTTDGGQSWSEVSTFLTNDPLIPTLAIVPETNGQVMVASGQGSAYTTDGGATWASISNDYLWGISFVNPTTGWGAAGWEQGQGGLISRFEGSLLTAGEEQRPEGGLYSENFPNPFARSTTIYFHLPGPQHVSLKVYDSAGKEVAALLEGRMPTGAHAVAFDGSGLPPGIYYYRLQAGEHAEAGKMALTR